MRSAGLKNITARHIALTSQALGIIAHLIPHLKTILQSKLNENQHILLSDFDRVLKVRI
jgi:vacuolar protein sorting-associated protein 54